MTIDQVPGAIPNQDPAVPPATPPDSLGWRSALPDQYKEHEFVKTFTKPGDFVKSALDIKTEHDALKVKMGNAIFKPGENATPEEKAAYQKALGVPEKSTDYEFPKGEGIEHDEKFTLWAKDLFHKAGISKDAAAALSQGWDSYMKEFVAAQQKVEDDAIKEIETTLRAKWKGDYDKNVELSKRAFKKFTGAEMSEFKAHPTLIEGYYEVGKAMGEDTSPPGKHDGTSPPTVGMKYNMPSFGG